VRLRTGCGCRNTKSSRRCSAAGGCGNGAAVAGRHARHAQRCQKSKWVVKIYFGRSYQGACRANRRDRPNPLSHTPSPVYLECHWVFSRSGNMRPTPFDY
jgi:hypothetical protein